MPTFSNILVHVDSRAETHPALDCAVELAKANQAQLKIVDVIPEFGWSSRFVFGGYERMVENLTQSKAQLLNKLSETVAKQGVAVTTQLLDGRTSVAIIREVLQDDHDLVVKSAKGGHSRRAGFFGTSATRLIRDCPCPVMILKPDHPCHCERVVAALSPMPDDELHAKLNATILRLAHRVTAAGEPHVVSVWSIYGESILRDHMQVDEFHELEERTEKRARRVLDSLIESCQLPIEPGSTHLLRGEAGITIPAFVKEHDADLLVMGSVGRAGVAGLLIGNTAEQILDRVECSVLTIKPEGFVSPIKRP